ncbi:MATE family efflux transporter [Treponema sp.]|uniref:MATE family efflux transporter n=1 Tax=Treponema sp. TaxID=166 RepID=UPI0025FD1BD9|nr:MATE family efflux transporter [Treponema sp.]MCR5217514.1 MATE family efflux transporter [Treponema sp.]
MASTFDLSKILENNPVLSLKKQIAYTIKLTIPGIIAQISSIIMQYIDASMAGKLGADASAAIGLTASSTWVLGSLSNALCLGFTVQVSHSTGAGNKKESKTIFFNSILCTLIFSFFLALLSAVISPYLPFWLGSTSRINTDATWYFLIFGLSTPLFITVYLMSGMLQCSGNMKLPAIMNALMCFMDVAFNWLFIFKLNLGVKGAALGTAASAFVTAAGLFYYTVFKNDYLKLKCREILKTKFAVIKKAVKIALPVGLESTAFTGALVVVARMIAPLGSAALAANSFATTAEALCYMPGYGVQESAITLVGQSTGAKRDDLTKSFSVITLLLGIGLMSLAAVVMWFACPLVFSFLTPDQEIQALSVKVLRIELFCEPFYAAAIVSSGALRGKGDTFIPGLMSLFSLWVVRLGLSALLITDYKLTGIWIAMTAELCFRGIILMLRLFCFKKKAG